VATGSTAERNHLGTAAPVAEGVDTDLTLRIPGNLPGLIRNKESLDQEKVHGLSVSESGRLHACKYFLSRLDTRRVEWGMQAPATSRGAHHCSVCEAVRFTRACTHRRAHTCVHTHAHARAHTHTHIHTHTHTQTHTHTHAHTHTHTHTNTHTHTHTRTHTHTGNCLSVSESTCVRLMTIQPCERLDVNPRHVAPVLPF